MKGTFTGFGVVLMAAALIGAGLKAAGFEIPTIKSPWRQAAVFLFGLVVVLLANPEQINPILFPLRYDVVSKGGLDIGPTLTNNIPFDIGRPGRVEVTMKSIVTHPTAGATAGATPELHYRLCGPGPSACREGQIGVGGTDNDDFQEGKGTLYIYNFPKNPNITFGVEISTPRKATLFGL